ncbi:MAG TPA: SpoIID/LytB domain-containing protein [Ignavibacteriaceae bacterium]|nr:SpoIID/LytB domain-containing protein [Ignavibacteriaceae bacterium]
MISLTGCSSSKRFTIKDKSTGIGSGKDVAKIDYEKSSGRILDSEIETIRVLLNEYSYEKTIQINSSINLFSSNVKIASIGKNNQISLKVDAKEMELTIQNKSYRSNHFIFFPADEKNIINIDGKKYRGNLNLIVVAGKINLINQISLEDYVKGVMTREMPLGKDLEHYEALKAFAICARTYAFTKIFEDKSYYDILPDTRDQVYGGVDAETEYSNRVVDETKNMILTYEDKPAIIFYHSTCGGYTEDAVNVFVKADVPYLRSVKDGSSSNCMISPRYSWIENIPEYRIIDRFNKKGYISGKNFSIKDIKVNSRFESGRINELEFVLINGSVEKKIKLYGNKIRSVIRTADDRSILRSNFFNIYLSTNQTVVINGRGNGHGVGMCQWGAIGLSRDGKDYNYILNHYFSGTEVKRIR